MRNIIVFGNVPLATWAVAQIQLNDSYNLMGVVCDPYDEDAFESHGMKEGSLYSYCISKKIRIFGFDEAAVVAKTTPVLGISIRYHKLFKKEYYECFSPGIINLHGGELPRYRGANIANYAVLEEATQVGGTLHFISKGIDEGDIVERTIIPINRKPTAFEYFSLTLDALKQAFLTFLNRHDVQNGSTIKATPQVDFEKRGEISKLYFKKGIEESRVVQFGELPDWDELYKYARAYTFPGHRGLIIKNGDEFLEIKAFKNDSRD